MPVSYRAHLSLAQSPPDVAQSHLTVTQPHPTVAQSPPDLTYKNPLANLTLAGREGAGQGASDTAEIPEGVAVAPAEACRANPFGVARPPSARASHSFSAAGGARELLVLGLESSCLQTTACPDIALERRRAPSARLRPAPQCPPQLLKWRVARHRSVVKSTCFYSRRQGPRYEEPLARGRPGHGRRAPFKSNIRSDGPLPVGPTARAFRPHCSPPLPRPRPPPACRRRRSRCRRGSPGDRSIITKNPARNSLAFSPSVCWRTATWLAFSNLECVSYTFNALVSSAPIRHDLPKPPKF